MRWAPYKQGFTIVELLIVVVVIAILAAITIVAYNGVTQRANASAAQATASQIEQKLAVYAIDHGGSYPTNLADADIQLPSTASSQYTANTTGSPAGYCVTVAVGGKYYYIAHDYVYTGTSTATIQQPTPAEGTCPGHGINGPPIQNLVLNPSAEINTDTYGAPNNSTIALSTTRAWAGARSLLVTIPSGYTNTNVGAMVYRVTSIDGYLQPNTTYTASAYAYVPTSTVDVQLSVQGTARAAIVDLSHRTTTDKNQWSRMWYTFTTGASGSLTVYVLNAADTTATMQFWTDGFMISEGTELYPYADGNSTGWLWDGAAGNSTSRGPVLQ